MSNCFGYASKDSEKCFACSSCKADREHRLALLVAKHFSDPFEDFNGYGEIHRSPRQYAWRRTIVQRIDDLVRGQRSTVSRIEDAFITPVLKATPVDLGLVLSKRIPDGVIEMIYALNKVAPDTADDIYFALWRLISTYVSKY